MSPSSTGAAASASDAAKTRQAFLPIDDPARSLNDSGLPSVMICAGGDAYDELTAPGTAGRTLDLDSCALAVGIYRAMTEAHMREIATLGPAAGGGYVDEVNRAIVAALGTINIEDEAAEYEFRGDDGDHTPSDDERALLVDFAYGLMLRVHEVVRPLVLSAPAGAQTAGGGWSFDMEAAPRDGTVVLLWREGWGEPSAAYWGLALQADGAGVATKRHPWVFLDSTNGLNGYEDGENGPSAWHPMLPEPAAGAEGGPA